MKKSLTNYINTPNILGRTLFHPKPRGIKSFLKGKKVLITGAGGSIGAELSSVILKYRPAELVLIDISRSNLLALCERFKDKTQQCKIFRYIADIKNSDRMEKIFSMHRPQIVYHAAAHKHVPLVETRFRAGILNNILGTKIIAELCLRHRTECFVLISTDKAINPHSMMGATKRIAEIYIQTRNSQHSRFLTVRFGNVFNSRGSAVPLFIKQIRKRMPVTITHAKVKRYFIDISEALYLILQATLHGSHSEIFMLDMGEAVKITKLVYSLARVIGSQSKKLAIQFIGLRPGEKLNEDVQHVKEQRVSTKYKKIKIWKPKDILFGDLDRKISDLISFASQNQDRDAIVSLINEIVPEYHPWKTKN